MVRLGANRPEGPGAGGLARLQRHVGIGDINRQAKSQSRASSEDSLSEWGSIGGVAGPRLVVLGDG